MEEVPKWDYRSAEPPPDWLLAEFATALQLMAKHKETVHLFDIDATAYDTRGTWTFIIGIAPGGISGTLASIIANCINVTQLPEATNPRDFGEDFCRPAMLGLNKKEARRVGMALDCAILYGILERLAGNPSLQGEADALGKVYADKVDALQCQARKD